jgi:MoxR-like ATPase
MLPDSQMDRFTIRMSLGYPDADSEVAMVMRRQDGNPMEKLQSLMAAEDLAVLQEEVASTFVHESVVRYIVALITATRENEYLLRGASPRATLSVTAMAKAVARLRDRDYVTPRDVQEVFLRTIGHRVLLSGLAENEGITVETVLEKILQEIPAPKAD